MPPAASDGVSRHSPSRLKQSMESSCDVCETQAPRQSGEFEFRPNCACGQDLGAAGGGSRTRFDPGCRYDKSLERNGHWKHFFRPVKELRLCSEPVKRGAFPGQAHAAERFFLSDHKSELPFFLFLRGPDGRRDMQVIQLHSERVRPKRVSVFVPPLGMWRTGTELFKFGAAGF